MCDVAPTRSSPRPIDNICFLLLGPASEPPRESRRPRCPPIRPDGKRPISFPHHNARGKIMAALRSCWSVCLGWVWTARPCLFSMQHHVQGKVASFRGPGEGFLESRWPAQTDADDCRKTEWGSHPFSFLGAALHLSLTSGYLWMDLDHGRCNMAFVATCRSKHSHVVCQFSLFYLSPASCL